MPIYLLLHGHKWSLMNSDKLAHWVPLPSSGISIAIIKLIYK